MKYYLLTLCALCSWSSSAQARQLIVSTLEDGIRKGTSAELRIAGADFKDPALKIIGGNEAIPNSHPYLVSIESTNEFGQMFHVCGGTLYDSSHVITAAHCINGQYLANVRVVAGVHDIDDHEEETKQRRPAFAMAMHEDFDAVSIFNDIAVIRVNPPFDMNEHVQTLRLPSNMSDIEGICTSIGWGSTTAALPPVPASRLQEIDLPVWTRQDCRQRYPPSWISEGMACAGGVVGEAVCMGDSGSTLICTNDEGQEYFGGIVSWGLVPCAQNAPSIYTRVGYYYTWLYNNLPGEFDN